jgi:hypothetical protein
MSKLEEHTILAVPKFQSEVCLNGNLGVVLVSTQPMPNWFHRTFLRHTLIRLRSCWFFLFKQVL